MHSIRDAAQIPYILRRTLSIDGQALLGENPQSASINVK